MKNHKVVWTSKKFGKPTKLMTTMLSRSVLSTVHSYEEVKTDCAPPMLTAALPKTAFQPHVKDLSLPFSTTVSTSSSVPWFSPGAVNWSLSTADLAMVKPGSEGNQRESLSTAWLSILIRPARKLLLQSDGDALGNSLCIRGRSALLFPASVGELFGDGEKFWQLDLANIWEPNLRLIVLLNGISGVCFEWRAPYWQRARSPRASELPPALRSFSTASSPQPLVQFAARKAFWAMERPLSTDWLRTPGSPSGPGRPCSKQCGR